jgi:hypothetical protein
MRNEEASHFNGERDLLNYGLKKAGKKKRLKATRKKISKSLDLIAHAIQIVIDEEISEYALHLHMRLHTKVHDNNSSSKGNHLIKFTIYQEPAHTTGALHNAVAEIYVREESIRILSSHAAVACAKREHGIVWPTTIWYNDPDSINAFRSCVRSAVEAVGKEWAI